MAKVNITPEQIVNGCDNAELKVLLEYLIAYFKLSQVMDVVIENGHRKAAQLYLNEPFSTDKIKQIRSSWDEADRSLFDTDVYKVRGRTFATFLELWNALPSQPDNSEYVYFVYRMAGVKIEQSFEVEYNEDKTRIERVIAA